MATTARDTGKVYDLLQAYMRLHQRGIDVEAAIVGFVEAHVGATGRMPSVACTDALLASLAVPAARDRVEDRLASLGQRTATQTTYRKRRSPDDLRQVKRMAVALGCKRVTGSYDNEITVEWCETAIDEPDKGSQT
jgi:hypothetical protein